MTRLDVISGPVAHQGERVLPLAKAAVFVDETQSHLEALVAAGVLPAVEVDGQLRIFFEPLCTYYGIDMSVDNTRVLQFAHGIASRAPKMNEFQTRLLLDVFRERGVIVP